MLNWIDHDKRTPSKLRKCTNFKLSFKVPRKRLEGHDDQSNSVQSTLSVLWCVVWCFVVDVNRQQRMELTRYFLAFALQKKIMILICLAILVVVLVGTFGGVFGA